MTTAGRPETMSSAMAPHFRLLATTIGEWLSDQDFEERPWCTAALDMAQHEWDDTWGEATTELAMDAIPRLAHAVDHLHAYAAIAEDDRATFSGATILRTLLVGLGAVYWQYDPAVDTRERVRRFYALRLRSLAEEQNLLAAPSIAGTRESLAVLTAQVDEIRESGQRAGFTWTQSKPGRLASIGQLDTAAPSDQLLIATLVQRSPGSDGAVGATLFRLLSAVAHAQPHGMKNFIHQTGETGPGGGQLIGFGLDGTWVSMMHTTTIASLYRTTLRMCEYMGWDRDEWNRIATLAALETKNWPARQRA